MNLQKLTLQQILKLDVKSNSFFEVYKKISTKYWTFEKPTEMQTASKTLVMYAERFDEDKVLLNLKIASQIMEMAKNKTKAAKGHLVFYDCEYFFDIYENENKLDNMNDLLKNAAKKIEKGDFETTQQD